IRLQVAAQRRADECLDLGGRHATDCSSCQRLSLQHRLGDVIAVARAALVGVRWTHAIAAIIEKAPAQERGRAAQATAPRAPRGALGALWLPPPPANGGKSDTGPCPPGLTPPTSPPPVKKEVFLETWGAPPPPKAPPADRSAGRQPPRLAANSPPIEVPQPA